MRIRSSDKPRRFWAMAVSASLVAAALFIVVVAPPASAANRAFTSVFTANTKGDLIIRGNSLETCLPLSTQAQNVNITCEQTQAGTSQQNNNFFMTYIDNDGTTGGNTTFNSSSATVTVPTGATVLYAGLTWGAVTSAGALKDYPALTGVKAPDATKIGSALFQAPGATGYSPVTSTTTDTNSTNYQAYADVTATVQAGGSGSYSVANVQAGTGGGNYAGWSLAVAYSDPAAPLRNLTVFTGYDQLSGTIPSVDIPVSGFLTPATGQVATNVGVVAYEGDKGSVGDGLSIGGTAIFNGLNPKTDVFNSSLTDLNVPVTNRTPNYANMLGFDIDRLDATGALANGSTSTVLHFTTANPGGETYYPGMITFATNLAASALTATKTATDANGGNLFRGDQLNYSVTVTNGGGDGSTATVLTDAIPAGTTYVPDTLKINGALVSDTSGNDTGEVTAGNVTARLGTGASSSAGGLLIPAASATVLFSVTVNSTVTDGTPVVNTALFSNKDLTTGTAYSGGSNTVTNNVVVLPSLSGTLAAGELTAPYSSGFTLSNGTGPFTWALTSGTLPAGLSIDSSTGLITGTPTATGSFPITVQVTDFNNRSVSKSQTITVAPGPTVVFTPPNGEVGVSYTATPTASGGSSPYTWTVSAGTLPAGLSINATTGAITGTPTAAGTTSVTVKATDTKGGTATQARNITIVAAPTLTFAAPPAGEVGTAYSAQLTMTGGVGTITWSISAGALPAGLTLDASTGLLSGTPTATGTSTFTVRIVDSNGQADTKAATIVVNRGSSTVLLTAPASTRFGTAVTLDSTVSPTSVGGTVTFTDVPTTGPQAGTTITLGTGTVATGAASLSTTLPAFGVNTITATYSGDATHAGATSTTKQVEVSAYAGEVIVTEYRTSGPGGAGDNYVELLNTGPTVPLAGMKITADSGTISTLPAGAGLLGAGRSYLVTGAGFTLAAIATSDHGVATVGTGGMKVTAPDTARTQTDAVGFATGFHTGTGLPAITGAPDSQWAWVRSELAGAAVDTRNNAADFQLVSTSFAAVGGVQPTLGSPSPTGTADPYQHNATLTSTLLDTAKGVTVAPNRVIVAGTPRHLVIRRTITNNTGATVTAAKVRVSALSERFGAPQPDVGSQPASVVQLRAINPAAPTEIVTLTGGASVTVHNLSVDAPSVALGGGLNSTFTVPLPGGGLAPGATLHVAFTFAVDTPGTFWFGYDIDATTATAPLTRTNRTATTQTDGRPAARRATIRHTAATTTGHLR